MKETKEKRKMMRSLPWRISKEKKGSTEKNGEGRRGGSNKPAENHKL